MQRDTDNQRYRGRCDQSHESGFVGRDFSPCNCSIARAISVGCNRSFVDPWASQTFSRCNPARRKVCEMQKTRVAFHDVLERRLYAFHRQDLFIGHEAPTARVQIIESTQDRHDAVHDVFDGRTVFVRLGRDRPAHHVVLLWLVAMPIRSFVNSVPCSSSNGSRSGFIEGLVSCGGCRQPDRRMKPPAGRALGGIEEAVSRPRELEPRTGAQAPDSIHRS